MEWWQAVLWGLLGGMSVEALELYMQIRRTRDHWSWRHPIPQGMAAYVVSVVIRSGLGALVAAATAAHGSLTSALAALGIGVAAPLVLQMLARAVAIQGVELQPTPAVPTVAGTPAETGPQGGGVGAL